MSAEPVPDTEPAEPALVLEGLGKLYENRTPRWRRILLPWSRVETGAEDLDEDELDDDDEDVDVVPEDEGWALRDVSFTVGRGEVVAIVGLQSAGPRTLMRILSGQTLPTEGRVVAHGRIGPMPEVMKMFVPAGATARQALRGVARAMGAPRELVRRRMDEIFELSGFARERDRDFRKISADARLRFLWAAVVCLEPAVLLIEGRQFRDDPAFQRVSIDRVLRDVREHGMGLVMHVGHPDMVRQLADRVVWLHDGRVHMVGEPDHVLAELRAEREREARESGTHVEGPLSSARLVDRDGRTVEGVAAGEPLRIAADVEVSGLRTVVECALELEADRDSPAEATTTWRSRLEREGVYTVTCTVPARWLAGGHWTVRLTIVTAELHGQQRTAQQDLVFVAEAGAGEPGVALDAVARWALAERAADEDDEPAD